MKTYLLENNSEIYFPNLKVNKRGFYQEEIEKTMKDKKYCHYKILSVEDELMKYQLGSTTSNFWELDEEVYNFKLWYEAYLDNNLNGFSLPIKVSTNSEYRNMLEKKLREYAEYLERPAFVYENGLLDYVKTECKLILDVLENLINGQELIAENVMVQILELFKGDSFLISDLDEAYSFRCIAPFIDLRSGGNDQNYAKMMNKELTFFRVRTKKKNDKKTIISDVEHILHLPYNLRDKTSSMRFSAAGLPGLYLGTNTYVCSKESRWNGDDELYASVFIPNDQGKKLKILNLTISQALINGVFNRSRDVKDRKRCKLQTAMLKIFPLVIATSFSVEGNEKIKYQYLLSQALMRVANRNGIDGIAYLSMKGDDEFQFPQGVNLAIPATDISDSNLYSQKCKGFEISKPILYCGQEGKGVKSYINEVFTKYDLKGFESFTSKLNIDGEMKFYGDTCYGKFDDFITTSFRSAR
jgi:hypothetical protein